MHRAAASSSGNPTDLRRSDSHSGSHHLRTLFSVRSGHYSIGKGSDGSAGASPRLAMLYAAPACQEEHHDDGCCCGQKQSVIQNPAGAEERINRYASEEDEQRDDQPDANPVPVNAAGHEPSMGARRIRATRRASTEREARSCRPGASR